MIINNTDDYTEEKECIYKNEKYSVRNNGMVLRHPKGNKVRPSDNKWTFGIVGDKGYRYIAGVQVHRIVATAFLGEQPSKEHVVDHKVTNKQNNRPENLRWLTREENILKNPVTIKKIEQKTGCSINEIRDGNWNILHKLNRRQNTSWMRPVTKDEEENLKVRQKNWIEKENKKENTYSSENKIGEWIFKDPKKDSIYGVSDNVYFKSLTEHCIQKDWRVPTEFIGCPKVITNTPLEDYFKELKVGNIFSKNNYNTTEITKVKMSKDKDFIVVQSAATESSVKGWYLAKIMFEDGNFIIESLGSYFTDDGADKYFTLALGEEWTGGEVMDDYC